MVELATREDGSAYDWAQDQDLHDLAYENDHLTRRIDRALARIRDLEDKVEALTAPDKEG